VLPLLLQGCLDLITVPCCAICAEPLAHGEPAQLPCEHCQHRLNLPGGGLQGPAPLRWWSLGAYDGALRVLLLQQRRNPSPKVIAALGRRLATLVEVGDLAPLVVSIPSWKRNGNPLPPLICRSLGFEEMAPLVRAHPTLGQHHLGRDLRALNQQGAFRCRPGAARPGPLLRRRPLLLVDDILTTGATAKAAAGVLRAAGYRVAGLLCLARTPAKGRDLRSPRRQGDRPG
jgi:predicted amidophosphoribosyltransferase